MTPPEDFCAVHAQVLAAIEEAEQPRVIRGYDGDKEVEVTAYPVGWPRTQTQILAAMEHANGLWTPVEEPSPR